MAFHCEWTFGSFLPSGSHDQRPARCLHWPLTPTGFSDAPASSRQSSASSPDCRAAWLREFQQTEKPLWTVTVMDRLEVQPGWSSLPSVQPGSRAGGSLAQVPPSWAPHSSSRALSSGCSFLSQASPSTDQSGSSLHHFSPQFGAGKRIKRLQNSTFQLQNKASSQYHEAKCWCVG